LRFSAQTHPSTIEHNQARLSVILYKENRVDRVSGSRYVLRVTPRQSTPKKRPEMSKQTPEAEFLYELFSSAANLAEMQAKHGRHDFDEVIRSMIKAIEKITGPLDNQMIDSWDDFADPLIAQGFVDATPGYYESMREG
jgi:hypothetical protein